MAFIDRLVALWKYERRWMQGVLEGLKFGETKIEPWPPKAGQVDKTAGDIEHYERKIAELGTLINRHPQGQRMKPSESQYRNIFLSARSKVPHALLQR